MWRVLYSSHLPSLHFIYLRRCRLVVRLCLWVEGFISFVVADKFKSSLLAFGVGAKQIYLQHRYRVQWGTRSTAVFGDSLDCLDGGTIKNVVNPRIALSTITLHTNIHLQLDGPLILHLVAGSTTVGRYPAIVCLWQLSDSLLTHWHGCLVRSTDAGDVWTKMQWGQLLTGKLPIRNHRRKSPRTIITLLIIIKE